MNLHFKTLRVLSLLVFALALAAKAPIAAADDFEKELLAIQHAWDNANYASPDSDAKKKGLEALTERARAFAAANPTRAEALVWQGIVLSSYAGAKGGFGALSLAKQARDSLLAAVKIDGDALHGSAYTSLGALYYKVPGFPIGFGNHDAAADYLKKALAENPDGIDPNFFYGEFLFEEGDYTHALEYLQKARQAAPRPDRPLADSGRRGEIDALITRVRAKMS
jgi:tetratricopeptide (TPR) repeat protein